MTDSVNQSPGNRLCTWILNPFHYVAGVRALSAGIALIVLAGLLGSLSDSHFDGVLDFHTGRHTVIWFFIVAGLIDAACMGLLLYGVGVLLSSSKIRILDVFGTQALARWPTVLTSLAALLPGYRRQAERLALGDAAAIPVDAIAFGVTVVVTLLAIVWMVVLMYRGFSVSCNVRGAKAWTVFGIALVAGEVLSKLALWPILKTL